MELLLESRKEDEGARGVESVRICVVRKLVLRAAIVRGAVVVIVVGLGVVLCLVVFGQRRGVLVEEGDAILVDATWICM